MKGHVIAQKLYPLTDCELCGKPGTERHHIDADNENNKPENIMIVCARCHQEIDGRLEKTRQRAIKMNAARRAAAPTHCRICEKPVIVGRIKNGRCKTCDTFWRRNNSERPYKGRDGRSRLGSRHSHAKLTEDDVREIRASGLSYPKLAQIYGVEKRTIYCVRARKTWKYVD